MTVKLTWRVSEAPTGPYRSFQSRSWPTATWAGDKVAAYIACEDSYTPRRARTGMHSELMVYVADHSVQTADGRPTFKWRRLKARFATLAAAKAAAQTCLEEHPTFWPKM